MDAFSAMDILSATDTVSTMEDSLAGVGDICTKIRNVIKIKRINVKGKIKNNWSVVGDYSCFKIKDMQYSLPFHQLRPG